MRNLPAHLAAAARHPRITPALAVLDLEQDPQHGEIGLRGELALPGVAAGLRIERVEPNATVGELLIDCEENRTLRAVLVGMLREAERSGPS